MRFDGTITLGNVLQATGSIIAAVIAFAAIRERLIRIETQIAPLWTEYNGRQRRRRDDD